MMDKSSEDDLYFDTEEWKELGEEFIVNEFANILHKIENKSCTLLNRLFNIGSHADDYVLLVRMEDSPPLKEKDKTVIHGYADLHITALHLDSERWKTIKKHIKYIEDEESPPDIPEE